MMAKSFNKLRDKMSSEAREKANQQTTKMLTEMPLQELRQARKLSQERLAEVLNVKQSSISKMERRTDMYVGTLRSYIEAMGGSLEVVAHFPDGDIRLSQFAE